MHNVRAGKRVSVTVLRSLLAYDPDTGLFRWTCDPGRAKLAGKVAGRVMRDGYRQIGIDGGQHLAHRLAWLYVHGEWPQHQVDHINGVRDDNRIANLRDVSRAVNAQNRWKGQPNSAAGLIGVSAGEGGNFMAKIGLNDRVLTIGTYRTADEAHAAYVLAKRRLHPEAREAEGEFAEPQRITHTRLRDAAPLVRELRAAGRLVREIAAEVGIAPSSVSQILSGARASGAPIYRDVLEVVASRGATRA